MKIREILCEGLSHGEAKKIIKKFLQFTKKELGLEKLPRIKIHTDTKNSVERRSFASYGNGEVNISISNRHINDCCRSIAHEIIHYTQDLAGVLNADSGKDGSEHENEANASAGIIMRKWAKLYPKLFATPPVE